MNECPWIFKEAHAWKENVSCQEPIDISQDKLEILWIVYNSNILN